MVQARRRRPLTGAGLATVAGALAAFACGAARADAPIAPDGIWYTKDQESIIRVHPCEDVATNFCGTIVWLKEPTEKDGSPKRDTLNKDPAKRTQPIVGLEILLDMTAEDDHWSGKAYNPDDGKVYSITFHVKTDKEPNDQADLRGCVLGFLCQTETFTRAKEVPGGDPTLAAADPAAAPGAKKHKKTKKDAAQR